MATSYTRLPQRFLYRGMALLPPDLLNPTAGKYPFAQNVRSYQEGTIQPREGITRVTTGGALSSTVHTIVRLNDPTSFAPAPALRLVGAGVDLGAGAPAATSYPTIDTGYSGDPLSIVIATPFGSPQPWAYIGDRSRQRKVNVAGTVRNQGIPAPSAPATAPVAALNAIGLASISGFDVAADWTEVGVGAVPSDETRVSTTISAIVYDAGSTGYASIGATAMTNIGVGMQLTIAGAETVTVTDLLIAIAATTIGAITYDSGSSGLCTIQPTDSLGTGQLTGPNFWDYANRLPTNDYRIPGGHNTQSAITPASFSRVRQIDFPVNCLVRINSGGGTDEVVRIQSVAIGPNGLMSFRCSTANTHAAGESLSGIAGFRAYTTATRSAGNALAAAAIEQVLTPTSVAPAVGGVQDASLATNLAFVGASPTRPEDELHLSVKVDQLKYVTEIRVYIDVDAGSTDFLKNYFFFAWRANDLINAIQATNAAVTGTVLSAEEQAALNEQIEDPNRRTAQPRDGSTVAAPTQATDPAAPNYNPYPNRRFPAREGSTGRFAVPRVPAAPSQTQLAVGNDQWLELRCRVGDLIRVGTALDRTLANCGGVQVVVQFAGTASPITVQYDSLYIAGGAGPDVGSIGTPYVWCYRYRSSATGIVSNPSPPMRGGVVPRRQSVTLTGTQSSDPQVDVVDWFRFGGQLTGWTYDGSSPNASTPTYTAATLDSAIEGSGDLRFDQFQPWLCYDLPRSGTCNVAGTAITRTGGDTFNTNWAPGTTIIVNGVTTTLYASPVSTSLLHVSANCGSGTSVPFVIREPLLMAQNLPVQWGGIVQDVVFRFACGDQTDPGALHWTHGNNPDCTSDVNWLAVTSSSDPLQNGCVYDGVPFVFSTTDLYRIEPTFGGISTFRAAETACGKGLWAKWAMAVAPEGIYFLAKDGLYLTAFGSPAQPIVDPDLTEIFPHDGAAGRAVTIMGQTVNPVDMSQTTRLRLSIIDRYLYFDYRDSANAGRTLVFDRVTKAWTQDVYLGATSSVHVRTSELGAQVENHLIGFADAHIYQMLETAMSDNGSPIPYRLCTPDLDGGDARIEKFFGDCMLDVNMRGATQGLSVAVVYNDGQTVATTSTIGAGVTTRQQTAIDLAGGFFARNVRLQITGSSVSGDPNRPLLYLWEPAFVPKVERSELRPTDWTTAGYPGTKQVREVRIRANTFGADKQLQIQYDGGTVAQTITINSSGERQISFALTPFHARLLRLMPTDETPWLLFESDLEWTVDPKPELIAMYSDWDDAGYQGAKFMQGIVLHVGGNTTKQDVQIQYDNGAVGATISVPVAVGEDGYAASFPTPFIAHVLRLVPQGAIRIIKHRWIYEPAPEAAQHWITQPTTFDLPGYFTVADLLIAYASPVGIVMTLTYDGGPAMPPIHLPGTGNAYSRYYQRISVGKGRAVSFSLIADEPFQIYQRDCSIRVGAWGSPDGYLQTMPFGGLHRVNGAQI